MVHFFILEKTTKRESNNKCKKGDNAEELLCEVLFQYRLGKSETQEETNVE
jgi:hypothetical protein